MPFAVNRAMNAWDGPFDRLPIGIYTCNREGRIVQYNRRAAELWGRAPELSDPGLLFCGAFKTYAPDGSALAPSMSPVSEVLRTGNSVREREFLVEQPSGARLDVSADVEPLIDPSGQMTGAIACFQDITRRKRAEQDAKAREQWHRELLEALPAAIYTTDTEGRVTFYNQAAMALSARKPELFHQWCTTWTLLTPEGEPLPAEECPMTIALKEGRAAGGMEVIAERPDGRRVPLMSFPALLRDSSGRIAGGVNMLVDITERKQAEERQNALVAELHHRIKNSLATVQALAAQTMRGEGSAKEMRESFGARLLALSRVHDELTRGHWQSADFHGIAKVVLSPYGVERVNLGGESVMLTPKSAIALAMVMHELATNAAKFGALSTTNGRLRIASAVESDDDKKTLTIEWVESGGPPVKPPQKKGFGSRLVERGIAGELQGTTDLRFEPQGVTCRMTIPLAAPG